LFVSILKVTHHAINNQVLERVKKRDRGAAIYQQKVEPPVLVFSFLSLTIILPACDPFPFIYFLEEKKGI
jgi:hypothetical protein